ncbi:MAG TPA: hypothetical protein VM345_13775 [Acidimicrobiales bacterium]|nr:hypothetical protein [Acidimicrobiales bacterium]
MKLRIAALAAAGALGATAFAGAGIAGPAFNNKYESTALVDECKDSTGAVVGTVTYGGPEYLWPPNHKMQPVSVSAADADPASADNDTVSLTVEIVSDEPADATGSGNTPVDSTAVGGDAKEDATTVVGELRSERSGAGDGRTYTLNYQAEFTNGAQDPETYVETTCAGSFEVNVPHDMRGGAGWKHDADGDGAGDNGKNGK